MNFDIFNGDADGIIALLQLRLVEPRESRLVTGVKRDTNLLDKISPTEGDEVTVLDISMLKNKVALERALQAGANIFYADHHQCGVVPKSERLKAYIDLDTNCCTGLIIDRLLGGKYHAWAITAAYGDNLIVRANELADRAGYAPRQKEQLRELGTLLNYNAYGEKVEDLHFHPAELFRALVNYPSPFDVIADDSSPYYRLRQAYREDMGKVLAVEPLYQSNKLKVFELENCAVSRRVSGVFGNWLANQNPDLAHVVLTLNSNAAYTVSLRAPLNNKKGAGEICGRFPTGGGREAAAGINNLAGEAVSQLIEAIEQYYK